MFSPYSRPQPRMHHWQGESGEWYWFRVCRLEIREQEIWAY
jgi:hypothetical protein